MEKIINFKAKKKKLIYKTEILDNICISDEVQIRINILANDFFFTVMMIIITYMIIISLKYLLLVLEISFNWMNIHFLLSEKKSLDSINNIIIIQFFII